MGKAQTGAPASRARALRFLLSPCWEATVGKRQVTFQRLTDQATLKLSGSASVALARAVASPHSGLTLDALARKLPGLPPAEVEAIVSALQKEGVLVPAQPLNRLSTTVNVDRRTAALLQHLQRRGHFTGVRFRSVDLLRRPMASRPTLAWASDVMVWAEAGTCLYCFMLRRFGRFWPNGSEVRTAFWQAPYRPAQMRGALFRLLNEPPGHQAPRGVRLVHPRGEGVFSAPVLSHPDCPHCRPAPPQAQLARELRAAMKAPPAGEQPGSHQALTDSGLGPLSVHERSGTPGQYPFDAPFVWGRVNLARSDGRRIRSLSTRAGIYGKGPDRQTCVRLAVSEGVERLMTLSQRPHRWAPGTGRSFLPLGQLFGHATPADQRVRRSWSLALELTEDRFLWVPFEAVGVDLPRWLVAKKALYREPFYSGAASHLTFADAVLHASLEVIERDAFMINWYRRRALPRVDLPTQLTPVAQERVRYLQSYGMELELFDGTLDFPLPVLLLRMTASREQGNWPAGGSMLLASCGFSATTALERVLGLAAGQFISLGQERSKEKDPLDARMVRQMERKLAAWTLLVRHLNPRYRHEQDFLGQGERRFEQLPSHQPATTGAGLSLIKGWLKERQMPWLAVRLTDPSAERAGFEVAKVIIPGLVRLAPTRPSVDFRLPRMHQPWPLAQEGIHSAPHPLY